eukprot:1153210-Pelagomonas_calceolata.AAC.3
MLAHPSSVQNISLFEQWAWEQGSQSASHIRHSLLYQHPQSQYVVPPPWLIPWFQGPHPLHCSVLQAADVLAPSGTTVGTTACP